MTSPLFARLYWMVNVMLPGKPSVPAGLTAVIVTLSVSPGVSSTSNIEWLNPCRPLCRQFPC